MLYFVLLHLNSNLTISECENIFTSVMTGMSLKAFKYGNLIQFRIYISGNILQKETETVIGKLSKYKPLELIRTPLAGSGTTQNGTLYIDIDGKIYAYVSSATAYYGANIVYFTIDV